MSQDPQVVFFDMDHTLIDNDCDVSWKRFLIGESLAPPRENDDVARFYDLYLGGQLPIAEFLLFQLRQFVGRTVSEMRELARRHFEALVRSRIYPQARLEVDSAWKRGIPAVMLTGTNRIVAEPLAEELNMDAVLATELEINDGRFTGRIVELYCFGPEKVAKARDFCQARGLRLDHAAYFGDSTSDIPMLEAAGEAVAVNPSEELAQTARRRGWRIVRWSL